MSVWAVLTGGRLVTVVPMPEVLRVLDDRDPGHANDHGIRSSIQGARCDDAMVDMMEGACRVLLSTDHRHGTCRGRERSINIQEDRVPPEPRAYLHDMAPI